MATQGSVAAVDLATFTTQLLDQREVIPRSKVVAQTISDLLPDSAVNLYLMATVEGDRVWTPRASFGDVTVEDPAVLLSEGSLGMLAAENRSIILSGRALVREEYAHLNVRRTLRSLAYVPMRNHGELLGAIEILGFESQPTNEFLSALQPLADVAASALANAMTYEQERHSTLSSITRITQLYDLEKVFSSTLELDELLPIIGSKFREILECQAVNVWMLQGDESVVLMHQSGSDRTVQEGTTERPGEGVAGEVSDSGEALLITEAGDERLTARNAGIEDGAVFSLMVAPLIDRGSLVGVLEAVNRLDGIPFDEDQLFALTTLTETAVSALHNASLLMAERKVEILEALVKTSAEITSTLDLDRVLQAIVNGPASVIPYERAAIALDQRGKIELKAVSGTAQINSDDPQYRPLRELLQWAAVLNEPVLVSQRGDEIDSDREESRAKFRKYFEETGTRACQLLPLIDEEGRVGILLFESSDSEFLSDAHLEMVKVLASQATVALRNASLYKEVPLIGVLQPLVRKKNRFLALEKHRRAFLIGAAAAIVLFLLAFPLPLRVEGTAVVAPSHTARVGSEFEGVIRDIEVREGDIVKKGTVLANLEDWEYRSALSGAKAKYQTAVAQMDRALANNDGTEAGMQRAQADYWASEVARAQQRLDKTAIRSPIDGVVATPHLENFVGHKLKEGDNFVEIIDNSRTLVDVAIDETDLALLRAGEKTSLKLDGFPTRTFKGNVDIVSPEGILREGGPMFFARVSVANLDGALRAGMQGRGKISTGWRPAGVVMFRGIGIWIWTHLWSWFGW